ncbi:LAFE_0H08900g1_1 [Lachancea fermentati]|uniref:LAFE_0H08900g1_1 n=1 Tax=Lachancea fermentati TaxID=4955 RepID=A0A1G4MK18_LACFM|nr:LAFE_0H08900g1_1 [Lachancea fermentati]
MWDNALEREINPLLTQDDDDELTEDDELEEVDPLAYDYDYDSDEDDYESQLLSAQQQWEESIEQLNQVLNWVLLPLIGKFLGRRTALRLWKRFMEYVL